MQDLRIQSNEPQPSRPEVKRKPEKDFNPELEEAKKAEKKPLKTQKEKKSEPESMSAEVLAKMLLNVLTKAPEKSTEKIAQADGGKKIPLLNSERNKVPPAKTPVKTAVEANQPTEVKTPLSSAPLQDGQGAKVLATLTVAQPNQPLQVEAPPQVSTHLSGHEVRMETALRFEHAATPASNLVEVREFKSTKSGGETQMRLDVDGEKVELRLSVKDGVAQVSMRTIRPEVAKLIQDSVHELVAGLEAQGLEVSVDVSQDEGAHAEKVAHNVQEEGENHAEAPKEQRWHYMAIRGRIYVVA